jgi:hypothetical protein
VSDSNQLYFLLEIFIFVFERIEQLTEEIRRKQQVVQEVPESIAQKFLDIHQKMYHLDRVFYTDDQKVFFN